MLAKAERTDFLHLETVDAAELTQELFTKAKALAERDGLPVVDGWAVLKELRNRGETRPIIIVTAHKDDRDKASALRIGATDFVTKPFRFSDLLKCIQTHLSAQ